MATPIYLKIKDMILEEIKDKPVNTPIASERDMAARYNASRMTVRNAVNELVKEGILYRDKNKGTFVADQKLIKKNTSADALRNQDDGDYTIVYFCAKPAGVEVAPRLNISSDDFVIRIVRINRREGTPVSVEEIYYIRALVEDEDANDLDRLLDLKGLISEGSIIQRFVPMNVPVKYINFLHLKAEIPIIMVESTIMNKNGNPLVYIREYNNPFEKIIEITV